jgi:hypothetical protein
VVSLDFACATIKSTALSFLRAALVQSAAQSTTAFFRSFQPAELARKIIALRLRFTTLLMLASCVSATLAGEFDKSIVAFEVRARGFRAATLFLLANS